MGTVDQHSQPVHLPDHRPSVPAQAGIAGFRATIADRIPRIVGEQHMGDADRKETLDPRDVAAEPVCALQMEAYRKLALFFRLPNVRSAAYDPETLRLCRHGGADDRQALQDRSGIPDRVVADGQRYEAEAKTAIAM